MYYGDEGEEGDVLSYLMLCDYDRLHTLCGWSATIKGIRDDLKLYCDSNELDYAKHSIKVADKLKDYYHRQEFIWYYRNGGLLKQFQFISTMVEPTSEIVKKIVRADDTTFVTEGKGYARIVVNKNEATIESDDVDDEDPTDSEFSVRSVHWTSTGEKRGHACNHYNDGEALARIMRETPKISAPPGRKMRYFTSYVRLDNRVEGDGKDPTAMWMKKISNPMTFAVIGQMIKNPYNDNVKQRWIVLISYKILDARHAKKVARKMFRCGQENRSFDRSDTPYFMTGDFEEITDPMLIVHRLCGTMTPELVQQINDMLRECKFN